jgi:probable rRNA maturation factor
MNITTQQHKNAIIYVENVYDGSLANDAKVESIPWQSWIEKWLESLGSITQVAEDCELSLRLTSDRQIQIFNQQYRSLDRPTDVLAFAATESDLTLPSEFAEPLYLGDILISLDTAATQAREQQHSLQIELAWLASHGLLHLLGWDHPDDVSLQQMLQQQSELVQILNLY